MEFRIENAGREALLFAFLWSHASALSLDENYSKRRAIGMKQKAMTARTDRA
jgi:hypothetical protein